MTLLDNMMKVSLILFVALLAARMLRRRSASLRHWILTAGIFCVLALPILYLLPWNIPVRFHSETLPIPPEWVAAPDAESVLPQLPAEVRSSIAPIAIDAPQAVSTSRTVSWRRVLGTIWVAGALFALGTLILGMAQLAWIASRSQRILDARWIRVSQEILNAYGVRRPLRLLRTHYPSMLATWGVWRPDVLLPASSIEWPEERVHAVLSHELAHIQRADWFTQAAAEILRAIYWFNPLAWMICNRLRQESEQACDDAALNRGIPGTDYAAHLLDLARSLNAHGSWRTPALSMARRSTLDRRFKAILNPTVNRSTVSRIAAIAGIAIFLGMTLPIAAIRAQAISAAQAVLPGLQAVLTESSTATPIVQASPQASEPPKLSFQEVPTEMHASFLEASELLVEPPVPPELPPNRITPFMEMPIVAEIVMPVPPVLAQRTEQKVDTGKREAERVTAEEPVKQAQDAATVKTQRDEAKRKRGFEIQIEEIYDRMRELDEARRSAEATAVRLETAAVGLENQGTPEARAAAASNLQSAASIRGGAQRVAEEISMLAQQAAFLEGTESSGAENRANYPDGSVPRPTIWRLNVAKSKFFAQPPKEGTQRIEPVKGGIKTVDDGIDAHGMPTHSEWTAKYDGKDQPVKGGPMGQTISLRRIDAYTADFTFKESGKVTAFGRISASRDGKSMTILTTMNSQGQRVSNTTVWDRQ